MTILEQLELIGKRDDSVYGAVEELERDGSYCELYFCYQDTALLSDAEIVELKRFGCIYGVKDGQVDVYIKRQ